MACKKLTVKSHKRCFCDGQLASDSACGLRKGKKKKSAKKKSPSKKACKTGTLKKYGKVCGCKTVGGGFKPVKAWRCKNKK